MMRPRQWLVSMAVGAAACEGGPPANAPSQAASSETALTPRPSASAVLAPPAPSAAPLEAPTAAPPTPATAAEARAAPTPAGACGRKPGDRIERVPWAHGSGNATCDALETLWANVPHVDRACHSDDECTIVSSDGNCIRLPLTKAAATRPEYKTPPCGNPMSGACPNRGTHPRCTSGCCRAD